MKVVVYAICKNERAFADRWMASMSEADEVYVLDTGSTDGTPQRLEELGAHVTVEAITPWRFDVARNRSLDLVPADADLCVCTDLDEVFQPGWREKVEEAWTPGVDRLLYRYTWNFLPDGRGGPPPPGALAGPGGPVLPPGGLARGSVGGEPGPGHHPAPPDLHQRGRGLGGAPLGPGQLGLLLHRAAGQGLGGRPKGGGAGP